MPVLPAVCNSCNHAFPFTAFGGITTNVISIEGVTVTCPRCRAAASVLDGEYQSLADSTLQLKSSNPNQLQLFSAILQSWRDHNQSPAELLDRIDQEAPDLGFIKQFLPKDASQLCAYVTVLLLVINLYLTHRSSKQQPPAPQINVEQNIEINGDADDGATNIDLDGLGIDEIIERALKASN